MRVHVLGNARGVGCDGMRTSVGWPHVVYVCIYAYLCLSYVAVYVHDVCMYVYNVRVEC